MSSAAAQATALSAMVVVCLLALHRLPFRFRIGLDLVCFGVASLFLYRHGELPFAPSGNAGIGQDAIWPRAVGGAWWLLGARLAVAALHLLLSGDKRSRQTRLVSDLAAAAVYLVAAAIVLNSVFALPVSGVVATSGVVAVVLGLALQSTLADLFAGIAVSVEAPFTVGDRVQINEKIEGTVVEANWRSIRVQTDDDNVAVIPNSLAAKASIVNQSVPTPHRIVAVEISCPVCAAPERVIAGLLEATLLCPDVLPDPAPRVILAHLGARRNAYKVSVVVAHWGEASGTRDALLRAARRQLHHAGLLGDETESDAPTRLLDDVLLFEHLDPSGRAELARRMQLRRLATAETLFRQGEEDGALYVVQTGVVELARQSPAGCEVLGCIGAGEYVGEIGLLTAAPHAATASVRSNASVYVLPRGALAPLLASDPSLASTFDRSMRRGLEVLHRQVAVHASPAPGVREQVLQRIRQLFGLAINEE